MNYVDVGQRSDAWHDERMGSIGASEIYDAVAKQKTGKYYAKREELLYKKLCERLGIQSRGYVSGAMKDGIERESGARTALEFLLDTSIKEVGIFRHQKISNTHASPDGVCSSGEGVELKCMQPANHIKTLITGEIDDKYIYQMQWQACCGGFSEVIFAAYNPDFPPSAQLFVKRIPRDNALIAEIETEVEKFLSELDQMESNFRAKYAD